MKTKRPDRTAAEREGTSFPEAPRKPDVHARPCIDKSQHHDPGRPGLISAALPS
jgi:hypothetical protein